MDWLIVAIAGGAMLVLGLFMAYVLGWASKTFHVKVDPIVEQVMEALPGANCGGCGYVGCSEYAEAVAARQAPVNKCPVGGVSCATALAKILGVDLEQTWPYRPAVHCGATYEQRLRRSDYKGEPTCSSANIIGGVQGCTYGCLGIGDCVVACRFDAIHIVEGLAEVDYDKCVGCGACEKACPRHIISMVPFKAEKMLVVACSSQDFGKDVKAVCKVGCLGCKACQRISELFKVEDNLPRINYEKYDPQKFEELYAAVDKCPMKRLTFMGKPSAKDLAAVAEETLPKAVTPDFETTVDKTDWHG